MTEPTSAQPRWMLWTGRVLSAIPVLLMIMSGVMKLSHSPAVVQGFGEAGIVEGLITPIGLIELACVVIYLVPPTAVLGAILMAGYLGGAVLTHLRAGQVSQALSPFIVGVLAWAGLWLRDARLRALLPTRKP
jgi:hypothetical protein